MTSRYHGRAEDLNGMVADLAKRLARLENVGQGGQELPVGIVTDTDQDTPPIVVTSGTFTAVYWLWLNSSTKRGIEVYMRAETDGSTTMEVRLLESDGLAVISPVLTVPTGSGGFFGLRGRTALDFLSGSVQVRARRASGAGTARLGVLRAVAGNFKSETF